MLGYDQVKLDLITKNQGYKVPLVAGFYDLYINKVDIAKNEIRQRIEARKKGSVGFTKLYAEALRNTKEFGEDELIDYLYEGYKNAFIARFLETEFQEFASNTLSSSQERITFASTETQRSKPIGMRVLELDVILSKDGDSNNAIPP
jgi:hypothetical protein